MVIYLPKYARTDKGKRPPVMPLKNIIVSIA